MNNYLTKKQIDSLLKIYYLKKYIRAAEVMETTARNVRMLETDALRCMRIAYSKSRGQGKRFNGKVVLSDMAERAGLTVDELTAIFDAYIAAGFESKDSVYWRRIRRKNKIPTAAELLDFIFMKYELKINPFVMKYE